MGIAQCQKSGGAIAGTNLGKDEALALENQQAWGEGSVCKDSNGDYFVLNGAVDLKIKGDSSPDDLRLKVVRLKSQTDDMKSDISGLKVQIEKDKKTLADLGKSQGFLSKAFHDPVSGFFLEAATVAVAFGLVTSLAEDALNWSMLNNTAARDLALQKMKNQHLQALGGCAAPIRGQQAKFDAKRAVVGAAVVGGVVAANSLLRGGGQDGAGQVSGADASEPLPDLSALSDADLKKLYQKLLAEYEALGRTKAELVKQKSAIESEIIKKGGQVSQETSLDKVMGNRTVRLMADAAAAFGVGSTLIRSRYQTYFKFHDKVEAGMKALDAQAKAQAINEIAAGRCQAEPVTATVAEPAKATVTTTEFSTLAEGEMCTVPTAFINGVPVSVTGDSFLAGGQWYAYDNGTSTQLVDGLTYARLTTPAVPNPADLPSVNVSETALQAFTEADFQPYLQYLGQNVSSSALTRLPQELAFLYDEPISASKAQGFWDTYTMPLEAVLPQAPDLVANAYAGQVSAEDIRNDVRQINKLYSNDLSDWNINGYRWALQQYMQGLEAGFRPEVSNLVTLAGKGGVVNRYFEIREIQKSRQATADIEADPRLSWEPKPARSVNFAEASQGYADSSALVAYNKAHPEIAQARREKIEQRPYDLIDARIDAFNKANAGLSWKITLMIATGQAVYGMPVAAPVAGEAGAFSWGQWAGAGAL